MSSMRDELVEVWRTNNRIHLFRINNISVSDLKRSLSSRGGRDVARQFAHLHDVRIYHLKKSAKDLAADLTKFQSKGAPTVTPSKAQLKKR